MISFANVTKSAYNALTPVQDRIYLIADTGELVLNGKLYNGDDGSRDWLCFTNTFSDTNTVKLTLGNGATAPTLEYSKDGVTWTALNFSTTESDTISFANGEKVYFRGDNPNYEYGQWTEGIGDQLVKFVLAYPSICTGSILSLFSKDCKYDGRVKINNLFEGCYITSAPKLPTTTVQNYDYYRLFRNTYLLSAPELPATSVGQYGYSEMFYGCTYLKYAPELPATTLGTYCYKAMFYTCSNLLTSPTVLPATTVFDYSYQSMFYGCSKLATAPKIMATTIGQFGCHGMFVSCTSLETAPELPATTLGQSCYAMMFGACSSLINAMPILPATTLAQNCYQQMFIMCNKLKTVPVLPATTLAQGCYSQMFQGCTSLETAPELPATDLSNAASCYNAMFTNCTSLKSAPALPATTLSDNCYYSMFANCDITDAPALNATNPATSCYSYMFHNCKSLRRATIKLTSLGSNSCQRMFYGCSKLSYINVAFSDWNSSNNGTTGWMANGVNNVTTCLFVCPSALDTTTRGDSTVLSNWKVASVASNPDDGTTVAREGVLPDTNITLTAGSGEVWIHVVNNAVINAASTTQNQQGVAYREVAIIMTPTATVTAGDGITFADEPEAGKMNICVVRWCQTLPNFTQQATLYVIDKKPIS